MVRRIVRHIGIECFKFATLGILKIMITYLARYLKEKPPIIILILIMLKYVASILIIWPANKDQ